MIEWTVTEEKRVVQPKLWRAQIAEYPDAIYLNVWQERQSPTYYAWRVWWSEDGANVEAHSTAVGLEVSQARALAFAFDVANRLERS